MAFYKLLHVVFWLFFNNVLFISFCFSDAEQSSVNYKSNLVNYEQQVINNKDVHRISVQAKGMADTNHPEAVDTVTSNKVKPGLPLSSLKYKSINNTSVSFLRAFIGLAVVIALIFILAWVAKKLTGQQRTLNSHIKILTALPLSTKEKLLLVDVCGNKILLGVGTAGISKISDIEVMDGNMEDKSYDVSKGKKINTPGVQTVDQMSIKQKICMLRCAVENQMKKKIDQKNSQDEMTGPQCNLSATSESDFSKKLKEFISRPKQPGCN